MADFYMQKRDRMSRVTSLGTGRGRHSQAKHAQKLRKDMEWDHKPKYTGEEDKGGNWSNFVI